MISGFVRLLGVTTFIVVLQAIASAQQRPLPIGSTWDSATGIFYWQPAPGFLGPFRLVCTNGTERISVRVVVMP